MSENTNKNTKVESIKRISVSGIVAFALAILPYLVIPVSFLLDKYHVGESCAPYICMNAGVVILIIHLRLLLVPVFLISIFFTVISYETIISKISFVIKGCVGQIHIFFE